MEVKVIKYIDNLLPDIDLKEGDAFSWSPDHKLITYKSSLISKIKGQWALLHEASHALLNHVSYSSDIELLKMEVKAWDHAKKLAKELKLVINDDHIEDCLDTYRDWLYRRSKCPKCGIVCLQVSLTEYSCHNCFTNWTVTASRFCRPYRLKVKLVKEKRLPQSATFS